MKYIVQVEEHLVRHVIIEANSENEAEAAVERLYRASNIVLDAGDFEGEPYITSLGAVYQRPELAKIAHEIENIDVNEDVDTN